MKKLDLNNMSKKDLNKIHTYLRAVIQLLYFIFIPSVYTAAFSGVKYIFTQIGTGDKIGLTSFTVKPQILYKKNNTKTANKKNKQIKKDAVSNCTASILICFLFAE